MGLVYNSEQVRDLFIKFTPAKCQSQFYFNNHSQTQSSATQISKSAAFVSKNVQSIGSQVENAGNECFKIGLFVFEGNAKVIPTGKLMQLGIM
jgi:hypothetical protein